MEDEQNYLNIRYRIAEIGFSSQDSYTEYMQWDYMIDSALIGYCRNREFRHTRLEIDFEPIHYSDPVYIICIELSRLLSKEIRDGLKAYSARGVCEYVRIFTDENEAKRFAETINEKNFEKLLSHKDNRGASLTLDRVFIEPMIITYWKQ